MTNFSTGSSIYEWQKQAQKKSEKYSNMDYQSFKTTLKDELKLIANHSSNFGCLIFVILGAITGLIVIIKAIIEDSDKILGGVLTFIFYIIIVIVIYPKFIGQYKEDRKKIRKSK